MNWYNYVLNDPLNHTDPTGLDPATGAEAIENFASATGELLGEGLENLGNAMMAAPNPVVDEVGAETKVAGEALEGLAASEKAAPALAGAEAKTFTTYTREKPDGTVYSGRTSGTGSAEKQVSARTSKADHQAKTSEGYGPAKVDKNSANKDAIRGREQQLIEQNGGAQSTGGTSGNAINGVSPANTNATTYQQACTASFGCGKSN